MIREWLRLLHNQGVNVDKLESGSFSTSFWERLMFTRKTPKNGDFSHEVLDVMNGCLACKSCSSQCPVGVDVPDFRAKFLSIYYQRYMRPLKDYFVANIEQMAPLMAKAPRLVNSVLKVPAMQSLLKKTIGYVDTPLLSVPTLKNTTQSLTDEYEFANLKALSEQERQQYVLIVQDPFTSFYDAEVVTHCVELIRGLKLKPIILPFKPNGKPQHVKGFLTRFERTARSTSQFLSNVASLDIPMIGVDASLVLCYRDEYRKTLTQNETAFSVQTVQEWLTTVIEKTDFSPETAVTNQSYTLLSHCTEKTALPKSEAQWQSIFSAFGLQINATPVGCCGMAGTYGHEADQYENSRGIYELSWQQAVQNNQSEQVLATGYSCRSQVARFEGFKPQHPLQILAKHIQQ